MLQHVLPANVDDDGLLGAQSRQVCEILIRSDADVNAPLQLQFAEACQYGFIGSFVGDEIVAVEVACRFAQRLDEICPGSPRFRAGMIAGSCQRPEKNDEKRKGDAGDKEAAPAGRSPSFLSCQLPRERDTEESHDGSHDGHESALITVSPVYHAVLPRLRSAYRGAFSLE